ncbi:low affinity iron permease family protein [Paenarthrobacter sp. DKR-5]|uniref:low affinity iron permease family protein n=1 Tax=Paenarthrobacter sp. DKR-5 TaxID=2835535 RepID=UPI001BDC40DF|nr:low affinity iron permease family protein [Paenarthrobacter sp. DKR-5]MBT1004149.1 low affinity iron permease family protein [Paenarthrobacter sp. DKR-5]
MGKEQERPDVFNRFTRRVSVILGHAWVFSAAVIILLVWGVSGFFLGFSDTWQLVINTGTTIVTFLMVFIIQNTQNRDTAAMNVKLDAVMRELQVSNAKLYGAEDEGEEELKRQRRQIERDAEQNSGTGAR